MTPPGVETVNVGAGPSLRTKAAGRDVIAIYLSVTFMVTVTAAVFAAIFCNPTRWVDVKDMLDLLVPAETALLGVAVAFYMTGD